MAKAVLEGATDGNLCITHSWPGQMRTVWGDHERFFQTYFSTYRGKYFTGDGCRRDEDGYYWITGRVDDVINVSGHRMGTAESRARSSPMPRSPRPRWSATRTTSRDRASMPMSPSTPTRRRKPECGPSWSNGCGNEIGPIATPDVIHFAPGLPKTRSGKIMRRILRKIAEGDTSNLGDISTLADPSVVETLDADLRFIEDAIRDALSGKRMESPKDDVLDPVAAQIASLTPTQLKVMLGVMEGRLNKQIAYDLGISEATVKAHMTAILKKLDVQNRTQAVLAAKALGMSIVHN
jgi:DNA-binding CsgD family transcriptional regulator